MDAKNFSVDKLVEMLMEELQSRGIPFDYNIRYGGNGGAYGDNGSISDGPKHHIDLEVPNNKDCFKGGKLSDGQVMGIIEETFHEYRHLIQTDNYKYHIDGTKDSLRMAIAKAIQKADMPEYYYENYKYLLSELDAEKYGIEEAIKFAEEHLPEVDAKKGIVDYVQDYIEKDKDDPFGLHMYDEDKSNTVEEILYQLQYRIDHPNRVNLGHVVGIGWLEDKYKEVFTSDFIKQYEEEKDVDKKDRMVFLGIAKVNPNILKEESPMLEQIVEKEETQEEVKPKLNLRERLIRTVLTHDIFNLTPLIKELARKEAMELPDDIRREVTAGTYKLPEPEVKEEIKEEIKEEKDEHEEFVNTIRISPDIFDFAKEDKEEIEYFLKEGKKKTSDKDDDNDRG